VNPNDELARLESQLRAAVEGPAWHGPAVLELLAGVSPADAAAHPIPGAHSIWELVLHLVGTYALVLRRLRGDATFLTADEDWPATPPPTEEAWQASIDELRALNQSMRTAVSGFNLDALSAPLVPKPPYTAYEQFIGLTQHDLYHAGQIALLKRALAAGPSALTAS